MSTSTEKNPSFTFPESGTYTVQLEVSLPSGKTGTVSRDIDVFLLSDVSFTSSANGLEVTFTDTSIAPNIIAWEWTFDDLYALPEDNISNLQNPVHTYTCSGVYHVTLTIHTLHGGIGFTGDDVTVTESIAAAFSFDDSGSPSVDFTDESTADSGIVSWSWDFGDGIGTSTDQNPSYTYLAADTYTVTLTVTSSCGVIDNITHDVDITIASIDFTWVAGGGTEPSGIFTFHGSISGDTASSWSWDYGDMSTATGQNPTGHVFSSGGYTVTLTVITSHGATLMVSHDIWYHLTNFATVTDGFAGYEATSGHPQATLGVVSGWKMILANNNKRCAIYRDFSSGTNIERVIVKSSTSVGGAEKIRTYTAVMSVGGESTNLHESYDNSNHGAGTITYVHNLDGSTVYSCMLMMDAGSAQISDTAETILNGCGFYGNGTYPF